MLKLIVIVLMAVGMWKIFEKAGIAGWKALIPFYNAYVMVTDIARKPWWYFLLLFVPVVNVVVLIIINIEVARAFDKSALYGGIGLTFFPFIFYLILGFGDSVYRRVFPEDVIDETRRY